MIGPSYLKAFRRLWHVFAVIAIVVGGVASALVSRPGSTSTPASASVYSASAIILTASDRGGLGNLETLAALVPIGEVPVRVARALGRDDPQVLGRLVQTQIDDFTGLMTITATGSEAAEAKRLADTFATELLAFAKAEQRKDLRAQIAGLTQQRKDLERVVDRLEAEIRRAGGTRPDRGLLLSLQQKEALIGSIDTTLQQLGSTSFRDAARLIQEAIPVRISGPSASSGGSTLPRLVAIAIAAILVAAVAVLGLERLRPRIYTKDAAEAAFGLPVLSEIPIVARRRRRKTASVVATSPYSVAADAYRLLASTLARAAVGRVSGGLGSERARRREVAAVGAPRAAAPPPAPPADRPPLKAVATRAGAPRTVLVVSAAPGEGKSTVVTNLAAAYAEMGRRALVLSCDLHRPAIHEIVGIPSAPGIVEAAASTGSLRLADVVVPVEIEGLSLAVVPSGLPHGATAEIIGSAGMARVLAEARNLADVVVIDTPPMLSVSDATSLLPDVDGVVVVARAGVTTAEQAEEVSELLDRLGARTAGVVLNRVPRPTMWTRDRRRRLARR